MDHLRARTLRYLRAAITTALVATALVAPAAHASGVACDPVSLDPVHSGGSVSGQLQCSTADSDPLSYSVSDLPAHGNAFVDGAGSIQYTADTGYKGSDAFIIDVSDDFTGEHASVDVSV